MANGEEDIDLRQFVRVLVRYHRWILLVAVVAATAAYVISASLPPVYEAEALLLTAPPRYVVQIDEKLRPTGEREKPSGASIDLATADALLLKTMALLAPPVSPDELESFRGRLRAVAGRDPSVLRLRARSTDRTRAAAIVNAWAAVVVEETNGLFAEPQEASRSLATRIEAAERELSRAEEALTAFQKKNRIAYLTSQLKARQEALTEYLAAGNRVRTALREARSLRERLDRTTAVDPAWASRLVALLLEVEAMGTQPELPLQITVPLGTDGATGDRAAQLKEINALIGSLERKQGEIDADILAATHQTDGDDAPTTGTAQQLAREMQSLQEQLQKMENQQARAAQRKVMAEKTFVTLSQIALAQEVVENGWGQTRIASSAAVPNGPIGPRKVRNAAVAGALGLCLAALVALVAAYWEDGTTTASS